MKELIIIGARGFGREVYNLALQCEGYGKEYFVKGFLDDKNDALLGLENYPTVISSVEDYQIKENDFFICALGEVKWKKKYSQIILDKGGEFMNLIHPSVKLNLNVQLGYGLILLNNVIISNDCLLGNFVTIQPFSVLGHDSKVGDWCHINAYSFMGGFSMLENEVCLNTRATVLPKIVIKKGATVGAASLVIRNVKEGTTVFGVPAMQLKF